MLTHLSVRNVATLADVEVDFPEGLVVLTGETGAGKSLILESLRFALGRRAKGSLIREGSPMAEVVAVFAIPSPHPVRNALKKADLLDLEDEDRLVLRRVIKAGGRSVLRLNGVTVPSRTLEEIRPLLADLTSQKDQMRLLDQATHHEVVDQLPELEKQIRGYGGAYSAWRDAESEHRRIKEMAAKRVERLDYLRYVLEECDKLNPEENEELRLQGKWKRYLHAEELQQCAARIHTSLDGDETSLNSMLATVFPDLKTLDRLDAEHGGPILESFSDLQATIQDLGSEIRGYGESIDTDPQTRLEMEERLNSLRSLRTRFGCEPGELLSHIQTLQGEREELENLELAEESALTNLSQARNKLEKAAQTLFKARAKVIPKLSKAIESRLSMLGMERCALDIEQMELPEPSPVGLHDLRILAQTNPGEGFHPIDEIASGGELSRLLLAIKAADRGGDPVLTTVFDEVDAGLGGETALGVARLLQEISSGKQVLCVSHLPQIAAAANGHLHVAKSTVDGRTFTEIKTVSGDSRLKVLGRMLGGDTSATALAHAEELLTKSLRN